MQDRLIHFILSHRKGVVAVFVVAALLAAACIPFVKVNYDLIDYLPPSAQSTEAVRVMAEEFTQEIPNANIMVRDVTVAQALSIKQRIAAIEGVDGVLWLDDMTDVKKPVATMDPAMLHDYFHVDADAGSDGEAGTGADAGAGADTGTALFQASIAKGAEPEAISALRALVDEYGPGNAVSGEASDTAQMQESMSDQVLKAVAIVVPAIIILLILSTGSWIEPVLFMMAIGISIIINMGTNVLFDNISFVTSSVSPILQLAVSLDYAIFLLHAFADERRKTDDVERAMRNAMRSSAGTIAASAVTTLFGFAALAFMQFQIGADLGLNLVKGIALSFLTVVVFLPALTMCLVKLIDKTAHRRFMPSFAKAGGFFAKLRIPALIFAAVLIVPAFLGQSHAVFTYQNNVADTSLRSGADTVAIQDEFGQQNAMAILVPRGDIASEEALSNDLASLDDVESVLSYAYTVGPEIPAEFAGEDATGQFYSDEHARIIAYLDTDVESEQAFATVDAVQQTAAKYYETYLTAGQSANLFDMKSIVSVDNVVVGLVAFIAIFLVVAATFRSLALPIVLLLTIETGIWINLCIPYFMGERINFIGYLVINTVQLGATIDYAILLTTHYLRNRKAMPARKAVSKALVTALPSLLVSAGILATAGFALFASSSIAAVSSLGMLLGRGAVLSLALVTCLLPALLVYGDRIIERLTWHADFAHGNARPSSEEIDHV